MTHIAEYTDIDAAQDAFEVAMDDTCADMGVTRDESDAFASDIVTSIALQCDAATAGELCRRELGFVPSDVLAFFPQGSIRQLAEGWL